MERNLDSELDSSSTNAESAFDNSLITKDSDNKLDDETFADSRQNDGFFVVSSDRKSAPALSMIVNPVVPIHTFKFVNGGDPTEIYETIILKENEILSEPKSPTADGEIFTGWYSDDACTTAFTGFGQTALMDDGVTMVYAGFKPVPVYVTYLTETGSVILIDEQQKGDSYNVSKDYPDYGYSSLEKTITGWRKEDGTRVDGDIIINEDLVLYPVIEEGYWVIFETGGGSYIDSVFYEKDEPVTEPTKTPTKEGYVFGGWRKNGIAYVFGTVENQETILQAEWKPAQVTYKIAYWLEMTDENGFYFYGEKKKTGTTDATPTFDEADKLQGSILQSPHGETIYFLNQQKVNTELIGKTIAPDGSTVINVYYDRWYWDCHVYFQREELNFRLKESQNVTAIITQHFPDARDYSFTFHFHNGNDYTMSNMILAPQQRFTSYAGGTDSYEHSNGERLDLTFGNPVDANNKWEFHIKLYFAILGATDLSKDTSYDWDGQTEYVYHDYSYDSSGGIVDPPTNGFGSRGAPKGFKYRGLRHAANPETIDNTKTIYYISNNTPTGYYGPWNGPSQNKGRTVDFFYERVKQDIYFEENGGEAIADISSVEYETPLSNYADRFSSYVVDSTEKTDANGVKHLFKGWYDNPGFTGKPVDISTATMPAESLYLYAKWEAPTFTVTFDPNGGTMTDPLTESVAYGDSVTKPLDPVKAGATFLGWSYNGKIYDFSALVTEDITLTAHYNDNVFYEIKYDAGVGTGTVPIDSDTYLSDATAIIKDGNQLTPPSGQHFLYWQDSNGVRYNPGKLYSIQDMSGAAVTDTNDPNKKIITLSAVYGTEAPKTKLTYNLNYDTFNISNPTGTTNQEGANSISDVPNNSKITLVDPAQSEIPVGYQFDGWYESADCTGTALTEVLIDHTNENTENIVYAKWTRLTKSLSISKSVTGNMGDRTKSFDFTLTISELAGLTVDGVSFDATGIATFSLAHGDTKTLSAVPYGSFVTVAEDSTSASGYITTYSVDGGSAVTGSSYSIASLTDDTVIAFTNDKTTTTPTGWFSDSSPWKIGIIGGSLLGVLWLYAWIRRRRSGADAEGW